MTQSIIRLAAAAATSFFFCATASLATTIAIFDINGGATQGTTPGQTILTFDGTFTADLTPIDPDAVGSFTFSATPLLNGTSLPVAHITLPDTTLNTLLANTSDVFFGALATLSNTPPGLLADPSVSRFFDVDFTTRTPTALAGSFEGALSTPFPLSFTLPQEINRYTVALDVGFDANIAVVPLPASWPLLGAGLAGLVLLGRRKQNR